MIHDPVCTAADDEPDEETELETADMEDVGDDELDFEEVVVVDAEEIVVFAAVVVVAAAATDAVLLVVLFFNS